MTGPDTYHGPIGSWQDSASCASVDPELFFPTPSAGGGKAAKAVCNRCPVLSDCRAYAVGKPWLEGIWGGLTADERRKLRRTSKNHQP